jgi:hypothetical protein
MQKCLEWKQREETQHDYMDNLYSECFHFTKVIFPYISNYFHILALPAPNHYIFKNSVICLNMFYTSNAKTAYTRQHVCLVIRNLQNSPGYTVTALAWSVSTCHLCHISWHSLQQFLLQFMQPYSTCLAHTFGRWYVIWDMVQQLCCILHNDNISGTCSLYFLLMEMTGPQYNHWQHMREIS